MLSKKKPQDKVDPEYLVGLDTASAQPAPAGVKNDWKSRRRPFHPGRASSAFILRFTVAGQRRKSSKLRSAPFIFLFFTHAANVQKERHCINCAVSFWWRIAGSNRWPLACHASALPNHALTHPHAKVREWTIFSVRTFYFEKGTFSPKSNSVA